MQLVISDEVALNGRRQMEQEHLGKAIIYFSTNEERMSALQRWFPRVHEKLQAKHPFFCQNPEAYPPAVVYNMNQYMRQLLPCGAFNELKFVA